MRRLSIVLATTALAGVVMPAVANANDGLRQAVAARIGNPLRVSAGFQMWLNGPPHAPDLMRAAALLLALALVGTCGGRTSFPVGSRRAA